MAMLTRTLTVVVHPAEEGGYWAEVLELPGCVSQGDSLEELRHNVREAIEAVAQYEPFYADLPSVPSTPEFRVTQPGSSLDGMDIPVGGTGTWTEAKA